ncbi:LOW QUALITY PROTEIN: hypothetical protein MAR_016327 [Mya arenaria]|uniref:G-protein coupled receptors family 1 profile domain-containing protein n=1 Tax=Mya arenaria TaxID=6604 RepID=A0ABY7FJH3_MYAAR|nr:LOW QUALITY PROTEIN: hypothetical protein MAR_016327 [Mya arenaria]
MGIALAIPFFLITVFDEARFYDGSQIMVCRTKIDTNWKRAYTLFIVCAFFVVPFFVLVYIYTNIIRKLMSETLNLRHKMTEFHFMSEKTSDLHVNIHYCSVICHAIAHTNCEFVADIFPKRKCRKNMSRGLLKHDILGQSANVPQQRGHNIKRLLRRYGGSFFVSNNTTPPKTKQPKTVKKSYKCLHIFVHHKEDNERKVNTDNKKNNKRDTERRHFKQTF